MVLPGHAAEGLPTGILVAPKPVARTWHPLAGLAAAVGLRVGEADGVLLTLRNTTAAPIELAAPAVLSMTAVKGDTETAIADARPPQVDVGGCVSPLPAGHTCAFRLMLGPAPPPGTYVVGIGIAGIGGGWAEATQTIRVRAPALLAFLVIVAGSACGWYVNFWRAGGRRALAGLIEAARLRDRLRRMEADAREADFGAVLGAFFARVDEVEARLRGGADAAAELAALDRHGRRIAAAVEIGRGLLRLPDASRAAFEARRMALTAALARPDPSDAEAVEVETTLARLATDVSAAANVAVPRDSPIDPAAVPATTAEAVPATLDNLPALDIPLDVLLPASGSGSARLERSRRRHEALSNGLILLVTGLGGVLALWSPDPTWGSVADAITAFLAGLASHVVVGETVARR